MKDKKGFILEETDKNDFGLKLGSAIKSYTEVHIPLPPNTKVIKSKIKITDYYITIPLKNTQEIKDIFHNSIVESSTAIAEKETGIKLSRRFTNYLLNKIYNNKTNP